MPKTLVIVRLDAIGDYVLFRNYLEVLRKSEKFKNYNITLFGNKNWKELAEYFDKDLVDSFIWIDKVKLQHNQLYLLKTLAGIYKKRFEYALYPNYSRDVVSDLVMRASNAPTRVGNFGDLNNMRTHQKKITDKYYTSLTPVSPRVLFEFYRNKEFVEHVLGEKVYIKKPNINVEKVHFDVQVQEPFAVLFPGAAYKNRRWDAKNFAIIADHLFTTYGYTILICGSKNEKYLYEKISKNTHATTVIDKTGHTLPELAKMLSEAQILVSNDTLAAHMGIAVGTKTICMPNGRHFGRFFPYPQEVFADTVAIYPEKIMRQLNNFNYLSGRYRSKTDVSVNDTKPETVTLKIDQMLKK